MTTRDLEVIALALKGKGKTPTVTLQGEDGDKFTLVLEGELQLAYYQMGQGFTVKIVPLEQTKFPTLETVIEQPQEPVPEAEPLAENGEVLEAFADVPEDHEESTSEESEQENPA